MNSLTDGAQSETLYIHLAQRYPETGGSIVSSLDGDIIFHMTDEEQVKGMDVHAGIMIDIGNGEEVGHIGTVNGEAGFLMDFPYHTLLGILIVVHKTAGQVERILGRLLAPSGHQQLSPVVQDEGCRRGTGILVIGKPTTRTMSAQGIVDLKVGTAALWTEPENL